MAKVVSDEILKLKIVVNGDEAQKRILDLELANKGLAARISEVTAKQSQFKTAAEKNSAEYKKNAAEIARLTSEIADNKKAIDIEIHAMNNMSLTMEQLRKKAADLKFMLSHMAPGTKDFNEIQNELAQVNGRMTELRTGAAASASSIGSLADKFNRYQGIALAVTATMTGVALSIQSVIDLNNKLADAQTTVSKTTGMNKQEVDELTKSFSEFNTRSSRLDLLKISEVGGRLGVPKEEIKDFTREVDKAYVALGDGFSGGVESVANKLGKIKGLFKETKDLKIADAMNQVGSAMNELGAAGAASEENIAEFALRVGSLPAGLKPTIAEALALGAAFEESGIDAERGATAYSNFVSIAAKNIKGFAEVMGVAEETARKLINTDPTEFFLQFSKSVKGLDATQLAKIFETLGISDQFVSKLVGSAAENVDRFRKSIDLSNKSLTEATSLQTEFDKVNTNAAAIFEKVRKAFLGMFTSEKVAKTLNWFIERIGFMVGVGGEANNKYRAVGETILFLIKIITIAAVSMLSYNTAVKLSNLTMVGFKQTLLSYSVIQKVNNFLNQSGTAIQNFFTASLLRAKIAYYGLRGATELQAVAQQRLNLITKANPWAALIAVVAAVTLAYFAFRKEVDETAKQQKILNDINKDAAQSSAQEISTLDRLYKAATNAAKGKDAQRKAAEELLKIYPEQFKNQSAEIIMNGKAEASYNSLRDAIINTARAKAAEKKLEERQAERFIRDEKLDSEIKSETATRNALKKNPADKNLRLDGGDGKGFSVTLKGEDMLDASRKRLANKEKQKENNKKADEIEDQFLLDIVSANKNKSTTGKTPEQIAAEEKANQERIAALLAAKEAAANKIKGTKNRRQGNNDELKEFQKSQEELLKAGKEYDAKFLEQQSDYRIANIELMQDGYDKEFAKLEEELYRERLAINKNINSQEKYAEVDKIIDKSTGKLKTSLQAARQKMRDEDAYWSQMELIAIETAENKKVALQEKFNLEALKKDIKNQNDSFAALQENSKDLINKATGENDTVEKQKTFLAGLGYSKASLDGIRTWEEGRREIEKYYQQKGLEEQVDFLRRKIAEFNVLMAAMPVSFSPEQLEQIDNYKVKINELLAEIAKLKNGGDVKGTDFSSLKSLGGKQDILGLNPDQWKDMFTKTNDLSVNIMKVGAAIQATQQLMGVYFQFMEANQKKELQNYEQSSEKKKRKLKTELQTGYINQESYKKLSLKIDAELDRKKAELEYKAAKRQRMMMIAEAISSTALAVVGALGSKPWTPLNFALAGIVGALGAVQLATIATQPLPSAPGAEEGYYPTIREQDGKLFQARRKRSATGIYKEPTMLVGEGGASMPELVVSGRDLKRINPDIQRQYMQEIARVKGYEDGLYPKVSSTANDEILLRMMQTIDEFRQVMQDIKDYGIEAKFAKTARNGKDLKETEKMYEKLENKSKR